MSIKKTLAVCAAIGSLYAVAAPAQTNQTNDLFRLTFRAHCRTLNTNTDRLADTILNNSTIISNALGLTNGISSANGANGTNALQGMALVYNTTADSIQVVNTSNGAPVSTVIDFSGVASTSDARERARLAFLFIPGETNAIGSALVDEHAVRTAAGQSRTNANIFGSVQFALTGTTQLGATNNPATALTPSGSMGAHSAAARLSSTNSVASTNSPSGTSTNTTAGVTSTNTPNFFMTSAFDDPTARICSGYFFTGQRLVLSGATGSAATGSTNRTPSTPTGAR